VRRFLPLALVLLAVGCGTNGNPQPQAKNDPPARQPGEPKQPPNAEVPKVDVPNEEKPKPPEPKKEEAKKTFSRDEVKKWFSAVPNGRTKNEVKDKFGRPDATYDKVLPGFRSNNPRYNTTETVTFYEYKGLTVDAEGSGKVDAVTRFRFGVNANGPKVDFEA
jgi:hypothetical protein